MNFPIASLHLQQRVQSKSNTLQFGALHMYDPVPFPGRSAASPITLKASEFDEFVPAEMQESLREHKGKTYYATDETRDLLHTDEFRAAESRIHIYQELLQQGVDLAEKERDLKEQLRAITEAKSKVDGKLNQENAERLYKEAMKVRYATYS